MSEIEPLQSAGSDGPGSNGPIDLSWDVTRGSIDESGLDEVFPFPALLDACDSSREEFPARSTSVT